MIEIIFVPDQAPKFDSYLSVGDVYRNNIADPSNGQKYNTTLISYYDKINNFKFDPNTKNITWQMPFDWNLSRIRNRTSLCMKDSGCQNPGRILWAVVLQALSMLQLMVFL